MHINEPWTAMSGMSQVEAEGRPLSDSLRLHSSQVSKTLERSIFLGDKIELEIEGMGHG